MDALRLVFLMLLHGDAAYHILTQTETTWHMFQALLSMVLILLLMWSIHRERSSG